MIVQYTLMTISIYYGFSLIHTGSKVTNTTTESKLPLSEWGLAFSIVLAGYLATVGRVHFSWFGVMEPFSKHSLQTLQLG